MSTSPSEEPPSSGSAVGGGVLGCLAGVFLIPIVVFVIVLIRNSFDPVCGTPADSGGCEMGLFTIPITSILPGAVVGITVGVLLALRRGGPRPPTP